MWGPLGITTLTRLLVCDLQIKLKSKSVNYSMSVYLKKKRVEPIGPHQPQCPCQSLSPTSFILFFFVLG